MEIPESKIIKVLTDIIGRLEDLEIEQRRNKKIFFIFKKRLMELNDFINDILDVIDEDKNLYTEITIEGLLSKAKKKQINLMDLIDEELDDDITQLTDQIVGES